MGHHIAWDIERVRIVGMTPCGRATIEALDMNDDRRNGRVLHIRKRDRDDGYHPPPDDPIVSAE